MDGQRLAVRGLQALVVVGLLTVGLTHAGLLPVQTGDYETVELRVTNCDGQTVTRVNARVAESFSQQYVGLSRTDALGAREGMVFTGETTETRRIVMRGMSFALDVVFITADGQITSIDTLPAPDGLVERHLTYPSTSGRGQYVLEMSAGWHTRTGVSAGDCVRNLP